MAKPIQDKMVEIIDAVDEFRTEAESGSDRAVIIFGATLLEAAVESVLLPMLDETVHQDLLAGSGGLTFSQRISLCYGLGSISADERRDLDVIRRVRNDAAHRFQGVSFGDQSIAERCRGLRLGVRLYAPEHIPLPDGVQSYERAVEVSDGLLPDMDLRPPVEGDARWIFTSTVESLLTVLAVRQTRSLIPRVGGRKRAAELNFPEDIPDLMVAVHREGAEASTELKAVSAELDEKLLAAIREQLEAHSAGLSDDQKELLLGREKEIVQRVLVNVRSELGVGVGIEPDDESLGQEGLSTLAYLRYSSRVLRRARSKE